MHRAQRQDRKDLASKAHWMEVTRVELQLSGGAFGTTMALVNNGAKRARTTLPRSRLNVESLDTAQLN